MGEGRQGEGEGAKQRLTDGGKEFGNTLTATSTNEQNCHHLLDDFKTRSSDPLSLRSLTTLAPSHRVVFNDRINTI